MAMEFFRDLVKRVSSGEDREAIEARNDALERQVFAVPLEDAKKEVAACLADPKKFIVEPAQTGLVLPPSVDALPPLVSEFFAAYDSVEETETFVWLSRGNIARSEIDGQLIRIGLAADHAEVVVKAGAEDVYVTDGTEAETGDGSIETYPTIYHFLLFRVRSFYPKDPVR
jgi:hypothetical protein